MTMLFCVFSFNRGRFLENCVRSIEQCVPSARLAVFDDNSDDEDTRQALDRIRARHAVLQPGHASTHRLGGLYGNMQSALERARDEDLVCFVQDDMQVVRPVSDDDIRAICRTFDADRKLAFLQPCFLKGCNRERDRRTLAFNPGLNAYVRAESAQSSGRHFSAVLLTRPSRLLAQGWVFARSEPENDRQASQLFGKIGHLFAPIAMWLPEVPAYRGKRKTLALRLAERRRGVGFFPFVPMSGADTARLKARSPDILPVAEDFLKCTNPALPVPWMYYPLQGSRLLKKLNGAEVSLRRLVGR
jgi:glycosyltransferase involved in cell wall biosynthesis